MDSWKNFLNSLSDPVVICDGSGIIEFANAAAASALGRDLLLLQGKPFATLVEGAVSWAKLAELTATDIALLRLHGARRNISATLRLFPFGRRWLVYFRELPSTGATVASLSLYYSAFQNSTDAILLTDLQANIIDINQAFTALFGFTRQEAIGRNPNVLRSSRTSNEFYRKMWEGINSRGEWKGEIWNRTRDGREIPVYLSITPLVAAGRKIGYMSISIDIAERIAMENSLRQSEKQYRDLIENSSEAIFGTDRADRINSWNGAAVRLFGISESEIIGQPLHCLFAGPPEMLERISLPRLAETGNIRHLDLEAHTGDGSTFYVDLTRTLIYEQNGEIAGASNILRDVQEIRRLQEQMQQAEKLAVVGQIAAGVAHEIGTPLNVISGSAEYLLAESAKHSAPSDELRVIIAQAERIARLIRRLLEFARPAPPRVSKLRVDRLLEESLRLLSHQFEKDDILLKRRLSPSPVIYGDKNQLQQVCMNILINAHQAIVDRRAEERDGANIGEIVVSCTPATAEDGRRGVEFVVQDNGKGISPEIIQKIFEPFFTTKEVGVGTGLGLAICQRIVTEHGGYIYVSSLSGQPTIFRVWLPAGNDRKPASGEVEGAV